jgi:hypothetical protein
MTTVLLPYPLRTLIDTAHQLPYTRDGSTASSSAPMQYSLRLEKHIIIAQYHDLISQI